MWKSNSLGVTARIRALHLANTGQRCSLHTTRVMGTPVKRSSSSGSMSEVPTNMSPNPQKRRDWRYYMFFSMPTLIMAVGIVGYVWYDHKTREKLKARFPASRKVIDAVFEYLPDSPSVAAPIMSGDADAPPKLRRQDTEALLPRLKDSSPPGETQSESKLRSSVVPPPPAPESAKNVQPTQADKEKVEKQQKEAQVKREKELKEQEALDRKLREQEDARRRQAAKDEEARSENASLEVKLEHIWEECDVTVRKAREVQQAVIDTTKQHTTLLKTAMDDMSEVLDKETQWQSVSMAFDKREEAKSAADQLVNNAKENLEKLRRAIDEGRENQTTKKNKALTAAKEKLNTLSTELNKKQNEVTKVESESRVMSKYKDLVDKGKQQFKKELASLTPDVKIGEGKKLSQDELNILIGHAHRRIEQLQKQLAEQLALEQQRIQIALSDQRDEDELITQARVKQEREKMLNEFSVEKDRWEADAQVQFEIELRRQLARQTAAHSDHLQDVIALQEKKMAETFERELHMRIIEDRQKFQVELSGWIARLRGIEKAIDARAETEMVAKEAQELWLACVALNGAIRHGNESGETWEEQLKPLEEEVEAVFFAAKNNPLVGLVLDSIPETAIKRGVYTEENLKERFDKVEKMARRVAMIDNTGGSLMKYFLSYLQSKFIFKTKVIDTSNDTVDVNALDTYQICDNARAWLQKNDIEQALKFMNLLTGEARRVAADWIEEARLLLETRQATYTVMAFASSTGLGTIF